MRKAVRAIALASGFAGLVLPLSAGEPEPCPPIDPAALAPTGAGLRAFRDPVTGKLRQP